MFYCTVTHPLSSDLQRYISLTIFVLFVAFVDKLIYIK